jgi:hypothetical protein
MLLLVTLFALFASLFERENNMRKAFFYPSDVLLRQLSRNIYHNILRSILNQGCQIVLGKTYQHKKNILKDHKLCQRAKPVPNSHKMYQMTIGH